MATTSMSITAEEAGLRGLVGRALEGCPDAFGELYLLHYRHVYWTCRRFFRRPEDAEDAAAEVFLKLYGVLGRHDPALPFRPWLSLVASRHCIDKLRRSERERRDRVEDGEIAALADVSAASPLAQVLREEERSQVREELHRLPEHYRFPLVMRYYKQMSYEEIAHTLGRRLPAVKTILFRAKRELRRRLTGSESPRELPDSAAGAFSPV